MPEIGTSGLMSGDGKQGDAGWPKPLRPSSTLPEAGENWHQFPDFPLLPTEERDYLPRHMRHPLGETPPAQPIGWLF